MTERVRGSEFMHWAKTQQRARYVLAYSGTKAITMEELGATLADLAIDERDSYGWTPLREAIGGMYGAEAERVVTATGTSGANHLALAALVDPGTRVVVEQPGYEPAVALVRHLGADLRRVPRLRGAGWRVDLDALAGALDGRPGVVLLTNLHNPTSAAIGEVELREIGRIASEAGARVVVDEVYRDAGFDEAPPSAATLGERFVVTSSLTKVCGLSGLRGGWIVAPAAVAESIWRVKNLFGVNDAHVAERLILFAIGQRPRLLARAKQDLDANRASWNEFLAGRGDDLEIPASRFGTTAFARLRHGDGDRLERHLRARYETSIVPGRFFDAPDHVRVGLIGEPADFREALDRLGRALDDLREGRA